MTRVLGIGGEPASGKSALVTRLLRRLGPYEPFASYPPRLPDGRRGCLSGALYRGPRVFVLGAYDGAPYPGTDRLSLSVQPSALALVRALAASDAWAGGPSVVLFEGDRLFNASFLAACLDAAPESRFLVLEAPEAVKAARRRGRDDTKPPAFLKGRATKYRNVLAKFRPPTTVVETNAEPADLGRIERIVAGWIGPAE